MKVDAGTDTMPTGPVVTKHEITVNGKPLRYTATAATLPVVNDEGKAEADIFYVSYTVDAREGEPPRPLIFAFNGGPGSSSAWLHLGEVGPKRIAIDPAKGVPLAPFKLEENQATWISFADVVLVDPVQTGLSRVRNVRLLNKFLSVDGDVDSLGRFIRLYLSRSGRWLSPLYLAGESYGTLRVGALADYLQKRGMSVSGVILISLALDMQDISYEGKNDTGFPLLLPALTSVAWYHHMLPPDMKELDGALREAESFASGDYLRILAAGDRLSAEERRTAAKKIAALTGLSPAMVEAKNLRIDPDTFSLELLKGSMRSVVPHDGRMTLLGGPSGLPAENGLLLVLKPAFSDCLKSYLGGELGFTTDREYFVEGEGIDEWNWRATNSYTETSSKLSTAVRTNPGLRIFAASGLYDLVTPCWSADYMVAHLDLPPPAQEMLVRKKYPGGHMVYLDPGNALKLSADVRDFIAASAKVRLTSPEAAVIWAEPVAGEKAQ